MFFKSQSSCTAIVWMNQFLFILQQSQFTALITGVTGDRESLPYTEATVLEISRLASVLPIAPPRQVETRGNCLSTYHSYTYAVHQDRIEAETKHKEQVPFGFELAMDAILK